MMADTSDIWPSRWPEPQPRPASSSLTPVRPIGDRVARFGVADELDKVQRAAMNGDGWTGTLRPAHKVPPVASRDGAWSRLKTWWACREMHPVDLWHRMRCRSGRHQIEGGQEIQLGGRFVNTERCCVWCGGPPR